MSDINFRCYPFNGVITVIARKLKVSKQSVSRGYKRGNLRYVKLVNDEVRRIKRALRGQI